MSLDTKNVKKNGQKPKGQKGKEEICSKPEEGMPRKQRWSFYSRNDEYVVKKLREGKANAATGTGWGFFDKYFIFLWITGFIDALDGVQGKGYSRKLVGITKLILSYSTKILLGLDSLNKVPALLFKEIALLQLIGFTAIEIREGVCKRGKGKSQPIHKDTLGDFLDRLTDDEVEYIVSAAASLLCKNKYIKGSTYILDSTDLYISKVIEGAGTKKYTKSHYDRKTKQVIKQEEIRHGFKIIVLMEAESKIIVAAKFAKLNEHESSYTLDLIEQARKNIGTNRIKLLLIDNAFMDGKTLWKLKKDYKIHFIVRVRTTMNIAADARSFRKISTSDDKNIIRACRGKGKKKIEVIGIHSLTSYDQYGDENHSRMILRKDFKANPLNVVMVTCWDGQEYKSGKEKVFITSLDVSSPLDVIDSYDLRSLIENCCFRELKQGWHINKYPKKTTSAIRSHSMLTLAIFSLTSAFNSEKGQLQTQKGIRRLRDENMHSIHKVVIFADGFFAILDIEELLIITRAPPLFFFRVDPVEVKKRFNLID